MYILGINAFHGDSSACLLKDGIVVTATEEERFRRIKHWAGFPSQSIKFCLDDARISVQDLDYITISRDPKANISKKIFYSLRNRVGIKSVFDRFLNSTKVRSIKSELSKIFNVDESAIQAEIHNIEHHRSHIASSFFASSFQKSAILSIDGFGDFTSTMTAIGENDKIRVLESLNYPHSLGLFYTTATQFLGFPKYGDEYKVMGLASYGQAKYLNEISRIVERTDDDFFILNRKFFRHFNEGVAMDWDNGEPSIENLFTNEWENLFWKSRKKEDDLEQFHIDLAASVQTFTEEMIFYMLTKLHEKTGLDNICITGGVAQNSVTNGKILRNTPFKNMYVPSAGHDAGTSIGSALYLYHHILSNKRSEEIKTAYFGKKSDNNEIIDCLEKHSVRYEQVDDDTLFDRVSEKLVNGGVIGWFQGRAEFGPRALGHRSIIVDPRRNDAKDLLNEKIKIRETFRPFAPSILEEYVGEYFVQNDKAPFMEKVYDIKKDKHSVIPAVTHVDGTGRLQSVNNEVSPRYYRLITEFKNKTGVPVLLNTSFNENEPIVNHPEEALDCFLRTKMDMLVMENIIIER